MNLNYEYSPITDRNTVASEYDSSIGQSMKLCLETGYHTFDSWKIVSGSFSKELSNHLEYAPEIISNDIFISVDNRPWNKLAYPYYGEVWTKIVIQTSNDVIFPDVIDGEEVWSVNSFRFLAPGETLDLNYPNYEIDGKVKVLDDKNLAVFGEKEFEAAFIEFHKRVSEIRNAD